MIPLVAAGVGAGVALWKFAVEVRKWRAKRRADGDPGAGEEAQGEGGEP